MLCYIWTEPNIGSCYCYRSDVPSARMQSLTSFYMQTWQTSKKNDYTFVVTTRAWLYRHSYRSQTLLIFQNNKISHTVIPRVERQQDLSLSGMAAFHVPQQWVVMKGRVSQLCTPLERHCYVWAALYVQSYFKSAPKFSNVLLASYIFLRSGFK